MDCAIKHRLLINIRVFHFSQEHIMTGISSQLRADMNGYHTLTNEME